MNSERIFVKNAETVIFSRGNLCVGELRINCNRRVCYRKIHNSLSIILEPDYLFQLDFAEENAPLLKKVLEQMDNYFLAEPNYGLI